MVWCVCVWCGCVEREREREEGKQVVVDDVVPKSVTEFLRTAQRRRKQSNSESGGADSVLRIAEGTEEPLRKR